MKGQVVVWNLRNETIGYLCHQHRFTVESWYKMIDETLQRYVNIHEDEAVMLGCMHGQITSIQIQLGFFSFKVMPVLLHYLQESFCRTQEERGAQYCLSGG